MKAKDLAEAMLDGSLNYDPTDDACHIAKSYIALEKLVTRAFDQYHSSGTISTKMCLQIANQIENDPATKSLTATKLPL